MVGTMEPLVVTRTLTLHAPAEQVWRLIADDAELTGWFGGEAHLDLRPGGVGRFVDDDGRVRRAVVDAVDAGNRVRWTWWDQDEPADASTVELTVGAEPDGTTSLTVTETSVLGGARACALAEAEISGAWQGRLGRVHDRFATLVGTGPGW